MTPSKMKALLWGVRKAWHTTRAQILFSLACAPMEVLIPLVQSYLTKVLLDQVGSGADMRRLAAICAGFGLVICGLILLHKWIEARRLGYQYYGTCVYQNELNHFASYKTDFENSENQKFKELFGYALRDSNSGNCSLEFIWFDMTKGLTDLLGIVSYGTLLAAIHPVLFVIVALISSLSWFTARWQAVYTEKHKREWEKEARKKHYLEDLSTRFDHAKDIKLYNLQGWLDGMMRHYQAWVQMWKRRCTLRGVWAAALAGLMTLVQDGAAYLFLIAMLLRGEMGVGDFTFYFGVVTGIGAFLTGIIADAAKLSERADKISYYRETFAYPSFFNHGEGCPLPDGEVDIQFKDVWYRYPGAEEDTIRGLNLTIRAGESIALVGLNGAGKTTLVKLICGLYRPTHGEILVNGKPIDAYNIEEYHSLISAVFQEIRPVAFTIFEFVASSDPERTGAREEVQRALESAGLWEKVQSLSHGMDTHLMKNVYDDGVDFSGGEMQRLLLARAIYKNGSILVLDEPTAALDPIAENNLYMQYRDLTRGKTSIYISHRFASTRFCDRIVLLKDGVIQESGSHAELMQLDGLYAELFNVQSQYYQEEMCHA